MPCYTHDIFSNVEKKLYEKFPKLKRKNLVFNANGKIINKDKTLEQNNIKIASNILIIDKTLEDIEKRKEIIAVIFVSVEHMINYSIPCNIDDKFSSVKQELFNEYPELGSRKVMFLSNGSVVNESITLKENKIKNGNIILICYNDY